jgi:hypothetical protein
VDNSIGRNLGTVLQNQDEVNQICLTYYHGSINKILYTAGNNNNHNNKKKKQSKKGKGGTKNQQQTSNHSTSSTTTTTSPVLYLAACDDAGTVRFMTPNIDTTTDGPSSATKSTILHHDPNGVAVVPTCAFRPTTTTTTKAGGGGCLDLVSGGTDCRIHLWDLSRPK